MQLIERGRGQPLVFIPGLQGRWEYARSLVNALAEDFRVVTFSLCDEPAAGFPFEPSRGFDSYADQVVAALDATGDRRAVVCGMSFGGLIALRAAAEHPDRVDALVLAAAPGPGMQLLRRHEFYAKAPRIFGPLFLLESPFRLRAELKAALPEGASRWAFITGLLRTCVEAPVSLPRMAARGRLMSSYDTRADCARITTPTLVVAGQAELDRVVPGDAASAYARLIAGAELALLERTGHIGALTRPEAFTELVWRFVAALEAGGRRTRRMGR